MLNSIRSLRRARCSSYIAAGPTGLLLSFARMLPTPQVPPLAHDRDETSDGELRPVDRGKAEASRTQARLAPPRPQQHGSNTRQLYAVRTAVEVARPAGGWEALVDRTARKRVRICYLHREARNELNCELLHACLRGRDEAAIGSKALCSLQNVLPDRVLVRAACAHTSTQQGGLRV